MTDTLAAISFLLQEISEHLRKSGKPQRTEAVAKLHRVSALASTLALTLEANRR